MENSTGTIFETFTLRQQGPFLPPACAKRLLNKLQLR
jgi:hypothetical protein